MSSQRKAFLEQMAKLDPPPDCQRRIEYLQDELLALERVLRRKDFACFMAIQCAFYVEGVDPRKDKHIPERVRDRFEYLKRLLGRRAGVLLSRRRRDVQMMESALGKEQKLV
jgi:hypothetical protein